MPITIPNIATTTPTPEQLVLAAPDQSDFALFNQAIGGNGVKWGCAVSQTTIASTSVSVAQGLVTINGIDYLVLASNVGPVSPTFGGAPRLDFLVYRVGVGLLLLTGTPNNPPTIAPPYASLNLSTDIVLATIYVSTTFITINNADITDKRPPAPPGAAAVVYLEDFPGADPTGVIDSTPALNLAIAALPLTTWGIYSGNVTPRPFGKIQLGVGVYRFGEAAVDVVQSYGWVRVEGLGPGVTRCFYYGSNSLFMSDGRTGQALQGPGSGGQGIGNPFRCSGGFFNLTMDGSFSIAGASGWQIQSGEGWDGILDICNFGPCTVPIVGATNTGGSGGNALATGTYGVVITVAGSPSYAPKDGMPCAEQQITLTSGNGTIAVSLPGWQNPAPSWGYNIYATTTAGHGWVLISSNNLPGTTVYIDNSSQFGTRHPSSNTSIGLSLIRQPWFERANLRGRLTNNAIGWQMDGGNPAPSTPGTGSCAYNILDFWFNTGPQGIEANFINGGWFYSGYFRFRGGHWQSNNGSGGYGILLTQSCIFENGECVFTMECDSYAGANFYTIGGSGLFSNSSGDVTTLPAYGSASTISLTATSSTSGANNGASARVLVQTTTGVALIAYTNVSGSTFTGCQLISGTGLLVNGGQIVDAGNAYAASPTNANANVVSPNWFGLDNGSPNQSRFANMRLKLSLRGGNASWGGLASVSGHSITNGNGTVQNVPPQFTVSGDIVGDNNITSLVTMIGPGGTAAGQGQTTGSPLPVHVRVQDFVT